MPSARRKKPRKEELPAPGNGEGTNQVPAGKLTFSAAAHDNDYQRLLIALRQAPVGSLLFLQLNSPVHRRQLPQRLAADGFQRSFAVADFAQLPAGPPPYGVLREFVEELTPKPEILFVDGLEHRIETQPDTILDLNLGRERLANLGVVVVFLLPAYVVNLIRSHALNLWSWRAHHYVLESPDDRHGQGGAVLSFTTGHTIPSGDTPETRDRRIRILQRLLTEGLAENRSPESLLRPVLIPLAYDLYDAGRFAEVLTVIDHLRSVVTSGEDSSDKAAVLNLQANALATLGEFDRAALSFQRALAIYENVLGPDHPNTAASLNNLAMLYYTQGLYAQAEPLYQRALAIAEQVLGPDHPNTATSLNNLAMLYYTQRLYAQAEPLYQRALAISKQVLGPDHPETATSLNNLAMLYYTQGLYAQAEPLYQRALAICEKVLGPDHPDTANSLNNLAGLYHTQGLYAQAEPLYQRALAIWEKALGPEHPHVATVLENYAALLRTMNREEEAEKLEARARGIREKQERRV